jgi:hypothetical protein
MTLTDAHSVHEQLPFAYLFEETLCAKQLQASLQRLLSNATLAILGGTIVIRDERPVILYGQAQDGVNMSFGTSQRTLQEFQNQLEGQATASVTTTTSNSTHTGDWNPTRVSPLFDLLYATGQAWLLHSSSSSVLATVRVTYPHKGGTILGLNLSHALADTASCLLVAACWGREMRGLTSQSQTYTVYSNERWRATTTGMISPLQAELFSDLWSRPDVTCQWPVYEWMTTNLFGSRIPRAPTEVDPLQAALAEPQAYTYVGLAFPVPLQRAMKAYGIAQSGQQSLSPESKNGTYVSKNDMVTAYGWLLQRYLSGRGDWNASVVMNLRGKGGVEDGLFGNGIANVLASLPEGKPINGGGSTTTVTKK